MRSRLLLLGPRGGAVRAARRLGREPPGLEVLALAERRPPSGLEARLARLALVDFGAGRDALVAAAREVCGDEPPAAVCALTERAVLPAARIRAELGLAGPDVATAERCSDKVAMKRALDAAGVPCARWVALADALAGALAAGGDGRDADGPLGAITRALGLPVVVKPARASGSRGQLLARTPAELACALSRGEIAERFVEGREMSVELLLDDGRTAFCNPTEYLVRQHANVVPAALPPAELARVRALAERAVAAVGLRHGMAHVELYLTAEGPLVGEIAARPPGGRLMALIERAYGFDPWAALLRLELGLALPELPRAARRTAGTWLLHPGGGKVAAVAGVEAARAVPHVRRVALRAAVGDLLAPRAGSGQDVGHVEAVGPSRDAVARALIEAHAALDLRVRPPEDDGEPNV